MGHDTRAAPVAPPATMGIVSLLDTVLTFTFMIPACIIAGAMIYGLDFLAKQEAAEKQISPVAASPGMELSLAELATYDGKTNGKPILVSVMGKVYDVGAGAGLYGTTGQYRVRGQGHHVRVRQVQQVLRRAAQRQVVRPHRGRAQAREEVRGRVRGEVPGRGQRHGSAEPG